MSLKHAVVRAALSLYLVFVFFQIYVLKTDLLSTFAPYVVVFFAVALAASAHFTFSANSIVAPLILWMLLLIFVQMNPLAKEIHFDYIGWMLLYFAAYSVAKRFQVRDDYFFLAAIWTLGTSYTASGLIKLMSSVWQNGEVLSEIPTQGFFLPWADSFVSAASLIELGWFAKVTTLLELSALPLILYARTRFFIWILLTLMQMGLLATTRINHISVAVLIFHALCFDPRWLEAKETV